MGQAYHHPNEYYNQPLVQAALHRVIDPIIEDGVNDRGPLTRMGMLNLYRHAAHELHRDCPEVPLRTAFVMIRSEVAHAIA